ncbi:hypothetical protein [Ralstonia pseudosolanacearum]|uniref:hypothetical protein n=1 Tax=Ralstonia pseudosolanacearum TaxID=1310165 RepID=UPI001300C1EB|nr:hypothetical protein [Ralstonia pseudosolanacearum]MCK4123421.1 hypothetical protein [Ralstonia pseudosolanacearum]MCK4152280.1 hypothetical protein [Ralstonia pseudosolanacearum]
MGLRLLLFFEEERMVFNVLADPVDARTASGQAPCIAFGHVCEWQGNIALR